MSKLQISRELDPLSRRDVAVCDKDHVRNGSTREHCSTDELTDEVYATVLICDSHDDANGYEEDRADAESEK